MNKDLHKHPYEAFTTEVGMVFKDIDKTLKNLNRWVHPESVSTPLFMQIGKSRIYSDPYGLALIIAPWNFPFQLLFSPMIAAIAAGNCIVLKPSEYSVNTAAIMTKIIEETFDSKYISIYNGGPEVSQALLKEKFDVICFTGSTFVGKIVYEAAAKHLTPVILELGGKCPCVIDENIPLKHAVQRVVWGKFVNAGQVCLAPNYLFVHENIKDEFIPALIKKIIDSFGKDASKSKSYGRIINAKSYNRISAKLEGAKLIYGGDTNKEDRYIEPTVIEISDLNDPIMSEEIFGPLLPVYYYKDLDEVIDYINSGDKPLANYIYTVDNDKAERYLNETTSGGACVNDCVMHMVNDKMPFGGVGASGLGSYHGKFGFDAFSHQKAVFKNQLKMDTPFRYAPYKFGKGLIKALIKYLT